MGKGNKTKSLRKKIEGMRRYPMTHHQLTTLNSSGLLSTTPPRALRRELPSLTKTTATHHLSPCVFSLLTTTSLLHNATATPTVSFLPHLCLNFVLLSSKPLLSSFFFILSYFFFLSLTVLCGLYMQMKRV